MTPVLVQDRVSGAGENHAHNTSTELIPKVKARHGRIGIDKWLRHSQAAACSASQVRLVRA